MSCDSIIKNKPNLKFITKYEFAVYKHYKLSFEGHLAIDPTVGLTSQVYDSTKV